MIIVQNPASSVPVGLLGAIILWNGVASALPSGWGVFSSAADAYVLGAQDGADISTSVTGSNTHQHTNSASGSGGIHNHSASVGDAGASGSSAVWSGASGSAVAAAHTHGTRSGTVNNNSSTHTHTPGSANAASQLPPSKKLYWIKSNSTVEPPVGSITAWYSSSGSIPVGWQKCDGTGGAVNLSAYFVYGAAADGDVGGTTDEPTHSHTCPATSSDGAHTHTYSAQISGSVSSKNRGVSGGSFSGNTTGHSHSSGSSTSGSGGAHTHTVGDTSADASLPPCLLLYYIQRMS